MKLFKPTQIDIKGKSYKVLLMGDDEIYFDMVTETVYYNVSNYISGDPPLIRELTEAGVSCVTTGLSEEVFNEIMHGSKEDLAKYLVSSNKEERMLADTKLKSFKDENQVEEPSESI